MTLSPILPGRLPGTLLGDRLLNNLQNGQRLLARLQDQSSTGQKFFVPSDSPAAATRTIALQRFIERKEQMQNNIRVDRSLLSATETNLDNVGDALNQGKSVILAGIGESSTPAENRALAEEAGGLVDQVVNAGNAKFRDRFLFGGSESRAAPFERIDGGFVRYNGDALTVESFIDLDLTTQNSIDGETAFAPLTPPAGEDINPALTLQTRIADLNGGEGAEPGPITVTVDDGTPQTETVDLAGAETVDDIKTRIEAAFPPGDITVGINAANNGLLVTPAAGTVEIADQQGLNVAAELGIESGPVASIDGADLDPRLTTGTQLADLNGGAGIDGSDGLLITSGSTSKAIDIASAQTVEDLFNTLKSADLDLAVGINEAGNGLAISSRLSGADFSIGENGGTDATDLGIRTLTADTALNELNRDRGVPVDDGNTLDVVLSDSTELNIDLSGANTVQDVLDRINAASPGNLSASLNTTGNGITLTESAGGTDPFEIKENDISTALGIEGQTAAGGSIVGEDVNPLEAEGLLNILVRTEAALENGDDRELHRLGQSIEDEVDRFDAVRFDVGNRLKTLEEIENRLRDENIRLQESLSEEFDADVTQVITEAAQVQESLSATLGIASRTLQQLNLFSFL